MNNGINFALLGCGRIAIRHAEILSGPTFKGLVAVCDLDREKAEFFGTKYSVPFFTDLHDMMATMGDRIDVVNVLTPTGCHAKNVIDISAYKKHIVVEKPMALTLEDAEEIIKACDLAQVKLFVVKQNRYNIPVQKLYEAVKSNRFGKIARSWLQARLLMQRGHFWL